MDHMSDKAQMLTPKEVADILGVHQKTVHLWLRSGKLNGIKISYRAWRIPKDSLDAFIRSNSNQTVAEFAKGRAQGITSYEKENQDQKIKNEIDDPQLKMKYYIRDIMGEKTPKK